MYRILYVDDESALLEVARVFLEKDGQMTVDTRTSAASALPLIESAAYDAVISDYQMPGMDGIQFLRKVREAKNSIPFILFTGRGREEIVIQALNEGADFYLQKGGDPVSQFAELSNKIRYAVNSKRAEAILREKTVELDRFFNSSLDLLCIADTEGNFRRMNPEWEHALGYPVSELEGKKFLEFVHPDDLTLTVTAVSSLKGQAAVLNFENRYRHKDGSYRWLEWRSYPYGDLIYAAARDITDRKNAEEALVREKTLIDAIFNSVPGMLYLYNAQGQLVRWNKKHELMTGYTPEELSRIQLLDWYKGDEKSQNAVIEGVKTTMQTGFGEAEADLQKKDGTKIPMYFTASPLTLQGQQFFAGLGIDITDRRKAEEALRASEEKYRRIVETAGEGIWSMDSAFTTVFANKKLADMLGYSVDEMLGRKIMEFMDPAELADNARKMENRKKGISEFYERKFRCKDGSVRWFGVSVTALIEPSGTFGGSFAMLTDITDRIKAEAELKAKNDELGAAYEQITASEEELRQNLDDLAASQQELQKSESKYRDLFDNAILGIFRSTPDGRYLDMNPAFARIAGYSSPREMMDAVRDIQQLYVRQEERMRLREMLTTMGEIQNFETEIRRTDGTTVWISINAQTARDSSGNILCYNGTIEDITGRRKAEMELARQNEELQASHEQITATEEELRQNLDEITVREKDLRQKTEELGNRNELISTILDTTPVGIFMVEAPSGKPVMANREAARLLGRGILPDATEQNLSEVYEAYRRKTGERYPTQEMPIIRGMRGETSHIDDMEVVRPDGTRVRLEIFGNPVRDFEGRIVGSLVTFLDITGH